MKKKNQLQTVWNVWLTQKKHMLLFSLNVKMIPAYFFHSFQGFSKRISCDPNPDSWSLKRRNEVVCIAHFLKLWFNHSFPFPIGLNWKLKKFSWAETMVSFAGFDEFAGFVILRTICWFRRNRARFGNAEFYAAMAFHETLLKSRVSSPKPWFRCLNYNFSGTTCNMI